MIDNTPAGVTLHDGLDDCDRVFLEKLLLATDVLLRLGEDTGTIPASFESELWIFRERVERSLLLVPGSAAG